MGGGGSHSTQGPPSYRVWGGGGGGASTRPCPTYNQMHAGFSFSYLRFAEAASFDKKELRRSCTLFTQKGLIGKKSQPSSLSCEIVSFNAFRTVINDTMHLYKSKIVRLPFRSLSLLKITVVVGTNHGGTWRTMDCRLCINCYETGYSEQ